MNIDPTSFNPQLVTFLLSALVVIQGVTLVAAIRIVRKLLRPTDPTTRWGDLAAHLGLAKAFAACLRRAGIVDQRNLSHEACASLLLVCLKAAESGRLPLDGALESPQHEDAQGSVTSIADGAPGGRPRAV